MPLNIKLKKSAGVPVTSAVHHLIRQGNAARDGHEWDRAASAYRQALDEDPALRHIWIQLGHMLKEAGRFDEAVNAYEAAFALKPDDSEPLVHIAHLRTKQGDMRLAATYFLRAIRLGEGDADALVELRRIIERISLIDPASLYQAARHVGASPSIQASPAEAVGALDRVLASLNLAEGRDLDTLRSARTIVQHLGEEQAALTPGEKARIVFDVTDLLAHFRHHRLPTGIQRVQIEVVASALRGPALDVRICCFVDGREDLLDIPGPLFMELAVLSTADKNQAAPEWTTLIGRVFIHLLLADPFAFHPGDRLVNLGTSWWVYNYFLLVRNAKRDFGIRYIPFIHDFIPLMAANHCVTGVIEDYVSWMVGVFDHADFYLVNSQSTGQDLLRVADRLGHKVATGDIEVVTLDADFRLPAERELSSDMLDRWDLVGQDYCLFVSTIESRKNHVLAVDAWARLIETYGMQAVPMLVCVGRSGWLNGAFFDRLNFNPRLRERVIVIERVSDDELALLYRQCRFTIYPSHYEGWGLPVTESLCYGKVPVVADNSSLREAGGEFALFFESNSVADLVAALERILFEGGYREALEADIATRFRPRSWASIAAQVTGAIGRAGVVTSQPPYAVPGRYYPVALYKGSRIWRGLGSGEMFRSGTGWLWPEERGSRTRLAGGELRLRVSGAAGPLRLYLQLRGLDTCGSSFLVSAGDTVVASGNLHAKEQRWVLGDIPAPGEDGILSIVVRGGAAEEIEMMTGGTSKRLIASISVLGFTLVGKDDEAGRMAFVEDAALGRLERIHAYAEEAEENRTIAS